MNKRAHGITLIELLIVVMILSVAALLVVPAIGRGSGSTLAQAAEVLAADIAYAQIHAISHGETRAVIVFADTHDGYHIAPADDPDTPITNPTDKLPYRVTFGNARTSELAGVMIAGLDLAGDDDETAYQLGFGIYGELDQGEDATITLAAGSERITLTVDPATGQVTAGPITTVE